MVQVDATNYSSEDDVASNKKPQAGTYHALITRAEDSPEKFPDKVIMDFEILAGTLPGQEGTRLTEFFATTPKAIPRLTRLAMCLGLLGPQEKKNIDFAKAERQQCVIEVEDTEYTKKGASEPTKTVSISYFGFWSVGNKAVANVPKNEKFLEHVPNQKGAESGQDEDPQGGGQNWDGFV